MRQVRTSISDLGHGDRISLLTEKESQVYLDFPSSYGTYHEYACVVTVFLREAPVGWTLNHSVIRPRLPDLPRVLFIVSYLLSQRISHLP